MKTGVLVWEIGAGGVVRGLVKGCKLCSRCGAGKQAALRAILY